MENQFQILVDAQRLAALIQPSDINKLDRAVHTEDLYKLLADEKITFGVSEEVIQRICRNPFSVEYPILLAKGIPAENGSDAYLLKFKSWAITYLPKRSFLQGWTPIWIRPKKLS